MRVLKKIALILLMLFIIYFSIGFLACIILISIEASTHQLSMDIGNDFEPWIIYLSLGLFAIVVGGLVALCSTGYYYLRKNYRNS